MCCGDSGSSLIAHSATYVLFRNDDGMIDFEEFQLMNRRYPLVLFPIFRLQDLLQKATLGTLHILSTIGHW